MKDSIRRKLEKLDERHSRRSAVCWPILASSGKPKPVPRTVDGILEARSQWWNVIDRFTALEGDATTAHEMAQDRDPATQAMGEEELAQVNPRLESEERALQRLLVPKDPQDDSNIFLEVRAGTGGDEAAIFAGDLFRMYARYAESKGWGVEILSESPGEHGGYKEIISRVIGAALTPCSNLNPAPIGCNVYRPPRRRAAYTPRPARWRFCPSWKKSRPLS